MGADLDLDELERLIAAASPRPWRIEPLLRDYLAGAVDGENRNVADMRRADAWLVVALANAAPALIAAARAAQHRGETLERVAEAVGYPRGAHYGDVLGRIDELVSEVARLTAKVSHWQACCYEADVTGMEYEAIAKAAMREGLAECERLRALCRRAGERLRAKARRDNVCPDPEMGWWHPDGDLIEALEEAGR